MWWAQLIAIISSGLLATLGYVVIDTVVRARRALARFKEQNAGLPMLDGAKSLLANHGVEFHLGRGTPSKLTKWHKKLGSTFGFLYGARPCASTIDLDLIGLIVHDESEAHLNRMPFNTVVAELERDGIFWAEGEQWRRIRRAFGPALRKFKLPNMVAEIEESISNFVLAFESKLNRLQAGELSFSIKLNDIIQRFSQDVVFRCLYKQRGLIDYQTDTCQWVEVVQEALRTPNNEKSLPLRLGLAYPGLAPLFGWIADNFTAIGKWKRDIFSFVALQTKLAMEARKHLRQNKEAQLAAGGHFDRDNFKLEDGTQFKRSVVDYIVDHYLDGGLTRAEYMNTSFFLFSAADKTVCDALIHTIYYLAIGQDVQAKLRKSLQMEGLESEYLTWVLNESLRLHPPATLGCSRTITRDIRLAGGHVLPAGTYVHTPLYTIHRLEKYWGQDAAEFRPERWANAAHFHRMQFIPFGAGRRACPGKDLALFEMKSLLISLLTKYKFQASKKDDMEIFDAPYTLYTLPNSPTFVNVSRISVNGN